MTTTSSLAKKELVVNMSLDAFVFAFEKLKMHQEGSKIFQLHKANKKGFKDKSNISILEDVDYGRYMYTYRDAALPEDYQHFYFHHNKKTDAIICQFTGKDLENSVVSKHIKFKK
jgi:hypothetical protein